MTEMSCTFISNSIVSEVEFCECLQKIQMVSLIEMNWILLCYFVMLDSDVVHLQLQFCCSRGWVVWASKENAKVKFDRNEEMNWILLCCFAMLDWDILHLQLQFYCSRGTGMWVSVWHGNDEYDKSNWN